MSLFYDGFQNCNCHKWSLRSQRFRRWSVQKKVKKAIKSNGNKKQETTAAGIGQA